MRLQIIAGLVLVVLLSLAWIRYDYVVDHWKLAEQQSLAWQATFISTEHNRGLLDKELIEEKKVVTELKNKKVEIQIKKEVSIQYVEKYRDNPNVGTCGIPGEFVYQYNAAVTMSELTPFRLGSNPTRERTYDDQDVLGVAVANVYIAHENKVQLNSLIEACEGRIERFNAEVAKINEANRGHKQ